MIITDLDLKFHPLADLFPLMQGDEFHQLVADIRAHGQHEPIVLLLDPVPEPGEHKCYNPDYDDTKCDLYRGDGVWTCNYCEHNPAPLSFSILDGRNRYRACQEVGIWPRFTIFDPEDDPVAFVTSKNVHRRHLSESQRAMIGAKLANMRQGQRTDLASIEATSQSDAAKLLNVSRSAVQRAAVVQRDAVPEVQDQVTQGNLSVSAAALLAEMPQDEQSAVVAAGSDAISERVRDLRASVLAAAERGLKPERTGPAARRNPLYNPNPQYEAQLNVSAGCREILEISRHYEPEYILSGFFNAAQRDRNLTSIRQCRDFLTLILEKADVEKAHPGLQ